MGAPNGAVKQAGEQCVNPGCLETAEPGGVACGPHAPREREMAWILGLPLPA